MNLHEVNRGILKNKKRKRVGRGTGSGLGKTSGRGHKGQGQLAGWSAHPVFTGGTTPIVRRIPKRGFNNKWGRTVAVVNISDLEQNFQDGEVVNLEALRVKNLAKGVFDELKVLGNGELTKKKLTVHAHRFSKSALEKIQQAGGEAVIVPGPTPVEEKKQAKS